MRVRKYLLLVSLCLTALICQVSVAATVKLNRGEKFEGDVFHVDEVGVVLKGDTGSVMAFGWETIWYMEDVNEAKKEQILKYAPQDLPVMFVSSRGASLPEENTQGEILTSITGAGEEKKVPVGLDKEMLTILTIQDPQDLNSIHLLMTEPSSVDIFSIKAPRKLLSVKNLDTISRWVRRGGTLFLWTKPEYIMDERLGFVGEYFGVQAKESDKNVGEVVAEVTPRCITGSVNQQVRKIMVSIPPKEDKEDKGCFYQSGFEYILAEREGEPLIVAKREDRGCIIAFPWAVNKEFFDGEIFWGNLTRIIQTPQIIGSMDVIEEKNGNIIEAVILKLTSSHLILSKDKRVLSKLLPLSEIQRIATRNYLLSEKIKQTAPWIEVITPGKATSP